MLCENQRASLMYINDLRIYRLPNARFQHIATGKQANIYNSICYDVDLLTYYPLISDDRVLYNVPLNDQLMDIFR